MARKSAWFNRARYRLRYGGPFLLIVVCLSAVVSGAWCAPFTGPRSEIRYHGYGPETEMVDGLQVLIARNNGNRFQRNYQEWRSLTPQEKETLRQRMQQLNRMRPQERRQLQELNDRLQRLSPTERRQLQRALDNWKTLSPSEKEAIRRRFGG